MLYISTKLQSPALEAIAQSCILVLQNQHLPLSRYGTEQLCDDSRM